MPRFTYTAKSQPHKTVQGEIEAESQQDAINKIYKMGYFPVAVQVEDLSAGKEGAWLLWKVTNKDIVQFTRQLSTLIESGVNILHGLNIVIRQTQNKYLKSLLNDVAAKIRDGKPLSDSLSAHPKLFSSLYTAMIRSGEVGGNIEAALKRLADFLEKEEEFKNSLRAALTYPAFILTVSVLTIAVLLGFVIPRLVSMFEDMGQALPLPTKILINLSAMLRVYWWIILAVIFAFVFLFRRAYRNPRWRLAVDGLKLKIPAMGLISLKSQISRLTRTLSLLTSSGIPIVQALEISASTVDNEIIKLEAKKFREGITGGLSFSRCLTDSKLFPAFVTNIVTVGEETGTLEKALLRIADDYEREVDRSLKSLTRLLEPVIILVMGLIVGFIVLSMLLPIFQINLIVR